MDEMAGHLAGRAAIVTGGGRGLGRAIALRLAADGADVLISDVDAASASRVAQEIAGTGKRAAGIEADVSTARGRARFVAAAIETFGRLDVLVNNAGIIRVHRPEDVTEDEWDLIMNVNCKAVYFACIAARPHLAAAPGGRIVNIASIAGKLPTPWWIPYGVSKAGVIALTRSLASAFAAERILVNCVCPGPADTQMWDYINTEGAARVGMPRGEFTKRRVTNTPLGRMAKPEDIARAVAFLCSPDSEYMTGQAINVDGGLVMF
jgi:meso-butanediol dehydrogenase / (S,S)-butanediol dehydrogenase / diacetyl reductase